MKATFGHQTRAPTKLINDNTVTLISDTRTVISTLQNFHGALLKI